MLKRISGDRCVKILCKYFDFVIIRQKGIHIILRKDGIGTVVPNHKELKLGTLNGLLQLAKINKEHFEKFL